MKMPSIKWAILTVLLAGAEAGPLQKRATYLDALAKRNPEYPPDIVDELQDATMAKVEAWMASKPASNCTLENAAVRREWGDLSVVEREEYIAAVLCLQSKPSKVPDGQAPGALNRFDDFVATHMTQAMMLHGPTHLFASHRYYIWAYETALREECGYTGYQPYMNYDRYAADLINSPMFNGNMSSMGGNGEPTEYEGVFQPFRPPYNMIPSAGGGGCVTEGPFKDMVVSLGPLSTVVDDVPKNPQRDGLGSNPRCLRRDLNKHSAAGATANYTYSLITEHTTIDTFYNRYLGQPMLQNDPNPWGLHNSGHYVVGGDPGGDFYASPGDPYFYFHHGMLDRIWWIWQMQDPENRVDLVPGMGAMGMNHPMAMAGPMGDLVGVSEKEKRQAQSAEDIIVDLGWTAGPIALSKLNDMLGGNDGKFCYVYV